MLNPELLLNDITVFDKGKYARYRYEGRGIPSVTELLSFIDSEGLVSWANKIGRQGIDNKDVIRKAADFGTAVHETIEKYLKRKPLGDIDPAVNICFEAFKQWWIGINSCHRVKILGQEEPLIGEYFAGTYDLLISIDDKPFLVDFKTSNHVGYKYFMQLAAYRYLLWTKKKINLEGCLILQFDKAETRFKEYNLVYSNPTDYEFIENCYRSFMGLVYTYYNAKLCQRQFGYIF
jgi:hypothetical protein